MVRHSKKKLNSKKRSTMRRKQRGGQGKVVPSGTYKTDDGETVEMYYGNPMDVITSKNLGFTILKDEYWLTEEKPEHVQNLEYIFIKKPSKKNIEKSEMEHIRKFFEQNSGSKPSGVRHSNK